jgi:large subunit ribosomal protein L24
MATATRPSKPPVRIKMRIRKGDTVQVISGKDKGKTGEVIRTLPYENRVVVEGINLRTRHVKPTQEGETGRIVTEEASVHASNVMLYSTSKKVASRVEIVVDKDGNKKRRLKKTGEFLEG